MNGSGLALDLQKLTLANDSNQSFDPDIVKLPGARPSRREPSRVYVKAASNRSKAIMKG
ncbi:hypothetical protein SAMN05216359_109163 [Roseateles sp. YR242]|nr:hypothetical protein SAMN05216359_109163 [Roseateles sp. YR242]